MKSANVVDVRHYDNQGPALGQSSHGIVDKFCWRMHVLENVVDDDCIGWSGQGRVREWLTTNVEASPFGDGSQCFARLEADELRPSSNQDPDVPVTATDLHYERMPAVGQLPLQ
jgi:hypothetical protein